MALLHALWYDAVASRSESERNDVSGKRARKMSKTFWAVVLFTTEESVEAVPQSWLRNVVSDKTTSKKIGHCLWPPKNPAELAKKGAAVEDSEAGYWGCHAVEILGEGYDTYERARCKSIKAVDQSDLDSSDTGLRKRIRKESYSPSPTALRKKKCTINNSDDDFDSCSDEQIDCLNLPKTPEVAASTTKNQTSCKQVKRSLHFSLTKLDKPRLKSPNPKKSPLKQVVSLPYAEFCGWRKHVNNTLSHLKLQIESLNENVLQVLQHISKNPNTDDLSDREFSFSMIKKNLPIDTYEGILNLEESLSEQEILQDLVNYLSKIGGSSVKEATKRILKTTLTDEVAQKFSFYGLKNKLAFANLKIKDAIFRAVHKNFGTCTDAEIETVTKDWLRQAKFRCEIRSKTILKRQRQNATNGIESIVPHIICDAQSKL